MFQNYIKIALRHLLKNRLYTAINILGLTTGLVFYLFGGIMVDYENNHDTMFANHERIYTIGSLIDPSTGISRPKLDQTYTALGPLIAANMPEAEAVARSTRVTFLVGAEDRYFNEDVWFVDKELLDIFDFTYLAGDNSALTAGDSVVLTETMAEKVFGSADIIGRTFMLDHEYPLTVKAVIADLPSNSHFVSGIFNNEYDIIASLETRNRIDGYKLEGNWHNLSSGNNTYVMTKEVMPVAEVSAKVNAIFQANRDARLGRFVLEKFATPLRQMHASFWDTVGLPILEGVTVLSLLILAIAIVNYANLATAQSLDRTKEVGLRKTLGGTKAQLLAQFLVESLTVTAISVVLALAVLEILTPLFNSATGKVLALDYVALLPWLFTTTLVVGLVAGIYPAYLITKTKPIEALHGETTKGQRGNFMRSAMLAAQFIIAIFILAGVMVVHFQNERVKDSSNIFAKDQTLVLRNLHKEEIRKRENLLRDRLKTLPGVEHVTFASQLPFQQSNNQFRVSRRRGDEDNKIRINSLNANHDFLKTFDIPLLAGRDFSRDIAADTVTESGVTQFNVIVNALLVKKLGYATPQDAVGKVFFDFSTTREIFEYTIIGVAEDRNVLGLHNQIKPWMFYNTDREDRPHYNGAVRIKAGAPASTVRDIEAVWKEVMPDYPIEHRFLSDEFNENFRLLEVIGQVMTGFAFIAFLLALIGLFGLSAFLAKARTKEIGIRKVMGATTGQLIRLLVLKFSKPVLWAFLITAPLAYYASNIYLNFFAENRFDKQIPVILVAGLIAALIAWAVTAFHAYRTASTKPIKALRHE